MDDPRLGTISAPVGSERVSVISFPFDEGCVRNGGRPGARLGPGKFLEFLPKMGCVVNAEFGVDLKKTPYAIAGTVAGSTLEEAHSDLEELVYAALQRVSPTGLPVIPWIVGGGNDQSYPNARAFLRAVTASADARAAVINVDAHFDVRPLKEGKAHSGSPFRLMLDDALWAATRCAFVEFGSQGGQCSDEHARFLRERGAQILWLSDVLLHKPSGSYGLPPSRALDTALTSPAAACFADLLSRLEVPNVFLSFDIDSISGADCPGVSCPATVGLTAFDAVSMCYIAGLHPAVKMVDVSELNPEVEGYRSPRLVVNMFYYFLMGLHDRDRSA